MSHPFFRGWFLGSLTTTVIDTPPTPPSKKTWLHQQPRYLMWCDAPSSPSQPVTLTRPWPEPFSWLCCPCDVTAAAHVWLPPGRKGSQASTEGRTGHRDKKPELLGNKQASPCLSFPVQSLGGTRAPKQVKQQLTKQQLEKGTLALPVRGFNTPLLVADGTSKTENHQ